MEIDAEILQNGTSTSPQQLANAINQDHDYLGEGEAKEVEAAEKVINAMRFYRKYCMIKLKRQADTIKSLPEEDKCLLITNSTEHLRKIKDLVEENQKVFEIIIHCGANILGGAVQKAFELTRLHSSSDHYMLKAKSTLKQIVRDWSAEGAFERDSCYRLVLQEMHRLFPSSSERHSVQVLVTGAGLARLAWELRIAGFSVTGNEFSYFMLLASNFILNACQQKEEFTIYPYVLDFSNSWNYENQLKPVKFPDVDPSSAFDSQRTNTFSMCAGDFLQAYADTHSQFDSVVSVFFIDTGPNPLQYIRLAHQILKSGGVWLNFGPLTYHHEDSDEPSLELPFSVILQLVEQCGFKVELVLGQGQHPPSLYTCNPDSMLQYNYHCGYFVARKI